METAQKCPNCAQPLDTGATFCGNCGQQITQGSLPAAPPVAPGPQTMAPPQVQSQPQVTPSVIQPPQGMVPPPPAIQAQPTPSSPIAQVMNNQMGQNPTGYAPAGVQPMAAGWGMAALPSYALATTHPHNTKMTLAIVFGALGIVGALFIPLIGIAFGITAAVLTTTSHTAVGRGLKITGIILSVLAILAGLGSWVYVVAHDPKLQSTTSTSSAASSPPSSTSVSTATVTTPCYTVTFASNLNVENQSGSCEMNAYDGSSLASSSNIYKVLVTSAPTVTAANLPTIAKSAIEKDISTNLPGFSVTNEASGQFASSPDYEVKAANSSNVAVVEAAVIHSSSGGNNFFTLVHAENGSTTDLSGIENGWQWQ